MSLEVLHMENGETVLKIERSKFRTAEMASKYGALCPQHFLTLFEALTIHRLMQCDSIERCSKVNELISRSSFYIRSLYLSF